MRLELRVNDIVRYMAAAAAPGYLSAHVNLSEQPKNGESARTVRLHAIQLAETETTSLHWPQVSLEVGDTVKISVLEDGKSDEPTRVRRSSELPSNLFSKTELAKELTEVVSNFDKQLMALLEKAKEVEPSDEYTKIRDAIGAVACETGERLLYPIYRRHKELIPEAVKGELL